MRFLDRFKRNPQLEDSTQEFLGTDQVDVPKSLFVDDEAPLENNSKVSKGVISEFLNRNYWGMGYSYGHRYQSAQILRNHMAKIQSDFLEAIDLRINELEDAIDQIRQGQIRGKGLSEEVDMLFLGKLEKAEESLKSLINERDLVAVGQGKVAKVMNDFRLGYDEGTSLAMDEDILKINVKV